MDEYFKLLCWIFCVWDVLILIFLGAIFIIARKALKILERINQRHSAEVSLQWDIYQELRMNTLAIEGKEE